MSGGRRMLRHLLAIGVSAAALPQVGPAAAQGSMTLAQGACAVGRAGAGAAEPCDDGSAILFNPAAIVGGRPTLAIGWSGMTGSGAFTHDLSLVRVEREPATTPLPVAFLTQPVSRRIAVGIGAFSPYQADMRWPVEGFGGRHVAHDARLRTLYVQPTIAYRLHPRVDVGAGVAWVRGGFGLDRRLDLSGRPAGLLHPVSGQPVTFGELGVPAGTDYADAALHAEGSAATFHLGVLARLGDELRLGARYLHPARVRYTGFTRYAPVETGLSLSAGNPFSRPAGTPLDALLSPLLEGGVPGDGAARTELTLPAQLVVGAAGRPGRDLLIAGDVQWTGWGHWDRAVLETGSAAGEVLVLDYRNTLTWRLGAELRPARWVTLRGGLLHGQAAQREHAVSPLFAEGARNGWSLGLQYRLTDELALDLGYQRLRQNPRRGRLAPRSPDASAGELRALDVGVYSADSYALAATVAWRSGWGR